MDDHRFRELLLLWRAGDEAAASELYQRFGPYIRLVIRRKLDKRLRIIFDAEDLIQDVWASLLMTDPNNYTFETIRSFQMFLNQIAHNKLTDAFRRYIGAKKQGTARLTSIEETGDGNEIGFLSRASSPSESVIAAEVWERLLSRVPADHRVILERIREGYTYDEIAGMYRLSTRTIKRIISRLKETTHS